MLRPSILAVALTVAACAAPLDAPAPAALPAGRSLPLTVGPDGRCSAGVEIPAVIETVTEQAILPAADQTGSDAAVRTVTRSRVVQDRQRRMVEVVCPEQLDAALVASLQRALIARGALDGPASGLLDGPTLAALQAYQTDLGLPETSLLTRQAAVALGLVALRPEELEAD